MAMAISSHAASTFRESGTASLITFAMANTSYGTGCGHY